MPKSTTGLVPERAAFADGHPWNPSSVASSVRQCLRSTCAAAASSSSSETLETRAVGGVGPAQPVVGKRSGVGGSQPGSSIRGRGQSLRSPSSSAAPLQRPIWKRNARVAREQGEDFFGGKAPLCTCLRVYAERGESHSRGGFPCERSIRPRLSLGCGGLKGDYSRSTAQ